MSLESPLAVVPLSSRGLWLGADAHRVAEILGAAPVRRLAGAHEAVAGVIAWRGRAVSLVDVAALLRPELLGTSRPSAPKRLIVAQEGPFLFAIAADAVREVQTVDPEAIAPRHSDVDSYAIAPRRASLGDISILLLDLAAIGRALTDFGEPAPRSSSMAGGSPTSRSGALSWPR
jgi:chemotaxis signal transduction protein